MTSVNPEPVEHHEGSLVLNGAGNEPAEEDNE